MTYSRDTTAISGLTTDRWGKRKARPEHFHWCLH
jgi:hypothetical protein